MTISLNILNGRIFYSIEFIQVCLFEKQAIIKNILTISSAYLDFGTEVKFDTPEQNLS